MRDNKSTTTNKEIKYKFKDDLISKIETIANIDIDSLYDTVLNDPLFDSILNQLVSTTQKLVSRKQELIKETERNGWSHYLWGIKYIYNKNEVLGRQSLQKAIELGEENG